MCNAGLHELHARIKTAGRSIKNLRYADREGPHSSILAWKIPWMEEHGGLQSMGLQRVRHD